MHKKEIRTAGRKLEDATRALIMVHGRGASAEDILGLAAHLSVTDCALMAPQATNHTWYPHSFLVPPQQNEPWLSSALGILDELVMDINARGMRSENIFFTGFSQGGCLAAEYVTRRARRWGGVAVFTGGLIGDRIYAENYAGDFDRTPFFVASSDPDPHVPLERVQETTKIVQAMNAAVRESIFPRMGHTITAEELALADQWVFTTRHGH